MKKIIQYTLLSSSIFISTVTSAIAEKIEDACKNQSTCNIVQYGSKLISPAYNVNNDEQAKKELSKLGWNEDSSIKFIEKTETSRLDDKGRPFGLDAQALIAKRTEQAKEGSTGITYYLFDFRGTDSPFGRDGRSDAEVKLVNFSDKNSGAKVHLGFKDYAESIANDDNVKEMIKDILIKQKNGDKISIISTGHSLGGAAATIFSAMLKDQGVNQENINTIVFGTPVPGNKDFLDTYSKEVTNVKINGDPIPGSTHFVSKEYPENFGKSIEIDSSEEDKSSWITLWNGVNKIHKEDYGKVYNEVFPSGDLSKSSGINFNFNKIRSEQIANNMNQLNSCISMFNSSQIGSSNCFIGYSPDENLIFNDEQKAKDKLILSLQKASEYLPAGSNIVQAPVDIVLEWNQKDGNPLDLDSHLVTPQGQHVYFNDRGQLGNPPGTLNAPNAYLYRDSIPDPQVSRGSNGSSQFGVEQTRIDLFQVTQQNGEYRFYVHNYSLYNNTDNGVNQGLEGISKSGAEVRIYQAGDNRLSTTPNDPNQFDSSKIGAQLVGQQYGDPIKPQTGQLGNTWAVFRLDTRTGVLSKDNRFGNVSSPADVPNFRQNP
jgi:Lipase (class 3)